VYAFIATGIILVLVLLRSVVRHTWVADALCVVLLSLVSDASVSGLYRRHSWMACLGSGAGHGRLDSSTIRLAGARGKRERVWAVDGGTDRGSLLVRGVFPDDAAPHRVAGAWSLYVILTSRPGTASRSAAEPLV